MSESPVRVVIESALVPGFPSDRFTNRIQLTTPGDKNGLAAAARTAEVLYAIRPPDTVPQESPRLRWVQLISAGINWIQPHPVWQSDIILTSAVGVHAVPMAEHFFALLLALTRNLPTIVRNQDQHVWKREQPDSPYLELRGKTLGILGWGKIGEQIAHLARAFGMRVIGIRRSLSEPGVPDVTEPKPYSAPPWLEQVKNEPEMTFGPSGMRDVLSQSDVVVVLMPHTAETHHVLSHEEFAAIKPGALFFNLGRGPVVQDEALLSALQSGHLRGAGLDVFDEEPLPPSSPFWDMPNVIVSPHAGGAGDLGLERVSRFFAVNLERYLDGRPLLNVVDRKAQY